MSVAQWPPPRMAASARTPRPPDRTPRALAGSRREQWTVQLPHSQCCVCGEHGFAHLHAARQQRKRSKPYLAIEMNAVAHVDTCTGTAPTAAITRNTSASASHASIPSRWTCLPKMPSHTRSRRPDLHPPARRARPTIWAPCSGAGWPPTNHTAPLSASLITAHVSADSV